MRLIVLIAKYSPSDFVWSNLKKDNRITDLSVNDVVNNYQGFEGELIYIFPIEENDERLTTIINQCEETATADKCLLLYVIPVSETIPFFLKKHAFKVGYDVGVCVEEGAVYSSIFHEVLFGHLHELISYKNLLNENLLFSDRSTAEKYVNLHNEMSEQGKGVEDWMEMTIYEIWKNKI